LNVNAAPGQLRRSALLSSKEILVKYILLVLMGFLLVTIVGGHQAEGQSRLDVRVHIAPAANKNNPVAVDLVLVSNKKLLKELMKMSAREWFERKRQIQLDYPKETDLGAGSWEWVPGQAVQLDRVPVRRAIIGGVVFANYVTDGAHRAVINPRKDLLLTLGEDDVCVQSAKEEAKPCP
jgi:type VI secretion system protein